MRGVKALFALADQIEAALRKSQSPRREAHAIDPRQSLPRRNRRSRSKRRTCNRFAGTNQAEEK